MRRYVQALGTPALSVGSAEVMGSQHGRCGSLSISRSTSADAAGDLAGVLVNEEARASGNVSWDVYSWYIGHLATPCLFISFLILASIINALYIHPGCKCCPKLTC